MLSSGANDVARLLPGLPKSNATDDLLFVQQRSVNRAAFGNLAQSFDLCVIEVPRDLDQLLDAIDSAIIRLT